MEIIQLKSKFLMGSFEQNTYVLKNKNKAFIIDAGAEVEDIKNALGKAKACFICITHLHFDHIWNLEKYIQEFDLPVYICAGAEKAFLNPELNASKSLDLKFNISQKNIKYYAKKLSSDGFQIEVIETPGHSFDSVCLLVDKNLFCGDTLFVDGVGRTDFEGGSFDSLKVSLEKILNTKFDMAFSGHYEPFDKTIAEKIIRYYI